MVKGQIGEEIVVYVRAKETIRPLGESPVTTKFDVGCEINRAPRHTSTLR